MRSEYLVGTSIAALATWLGAGGCGGSSSSRVPEPLLGGPVLRSNIVVFDRANQRIGFAPHQPCK
jgi:hypothetical protein